MASYYNENDKYAAAWIRQLIADKLIPDGFVDQRSIVDVRPEDLAGFTQCHFFVGIGGWSRALELAGWPVDKPIWTGSCPCQPFSSAGLQQGTKDERHLWPYFFNLIRACKPSVVVGEQVASKMALGWLDGVFSALESADYACGAIDTSAASVGAPHIRQRLYWVANAKCDAGEPRGITDESCEGTGESHGRTSVESGRRGVPSRMGDASSGGCVEHAKSDRQEKQNSPNGNSQGTDFNGPSFSERMGNPDISRSQGQQLGGDCADQRSSGQASLGSGFWDDYEFIACADGKTRRAKRGIFPLAPGVPRGMVRGGDQGIPINANATGEARTMRLRGYGNALNAECAAEFMRVVQEIT